MLISDSNSTTSISVVSILIGLSIVVEIGPSFILLSAFLISHST